MKTNRQKMISALIREGRAAKGFTQKELSELTNISVRSIQRIENGEILPRNYTLKTLAETLGLSFETIQKTEPGQKQFFNASRGQKIILSTGISVFILLISWAFIAQSPKFPETAFELLVFLAFVLLVITIILMIIWRTKP
jgi:transcriptional regulator with XRE-family HTH domain